MKKLPKWVPILIVAIVITAIAAGVVNAFVLDRGQAAKPAPASASQPQPSASAEPVTAASDRANDQANREVVAKGAVVPLQHATLSMAATGIAWEVPVQEGDRVKAGDVIVRLNNGRQQAAVAEASAGLANAQAQLALVKAGPRAESVAAAQAGLDAAQARVQRLKEAGRTGDLAAGQASLAASRAALDRLNKGPDENARIAAATDVANAEAGLKAAQAAYDRVQGQPNVAMMPQSLQLEQATNAYNAAKARYDELVAPPKADRVAQAQAQIKQAQADLDRLNKPTTEAEIAEAEAMLRQSQAQLDLLKAGARDQEVAAAQAAVAQAEAAQQQAQASLADTELHAPFAGVVAALRVRQGEQVGAGTPVAELGDVGGWQVETDDLSELDIVRVKPGEKVGLAFDAIPGLKLQGTVERVQPKGEKKLGDMTYTAVIRIENPDPRLLWNMTAVVTLP